VNNKISPNHQKLIEFKFGMKKKKIRGHKRRQKQIEIWRQKALSFNLIEYLENNSQTCFMKLAIHPWNGLSLINSTPKEPNSHTKRQIISTLCEIYSNWKRQLDSIGIPYYLKIWLFDPQISQSQVVCAVGDQLDFYQNTFYKPEVNLQFPLNKFGKINTGFEQFKWEYHLDEFHLDNTYLDEAEIGGNKSWISKQMKKPHRTVHLNKPIGDVVETYSFKKNNVWIGSYESI
jgi:hypothetical protein